MKRLILISTLFTIATASYAQSGGNNNDYNNSNTGTPKEVRSLGRNPEYPFIRNCSTPEQVVVALKRYGKSDKKGARHLNKMLMDIGFTNGVNDLTADDITPSRLPAGTRGDMGDGNYNSSYVTLNTDGGSGTKAWKIRNPNGSSMYLLGRCGNAFYPAKGTACLTVPLNLSGDTKEVTLDNSSLQTGQDKVFVYYHRRKHKHNQTSYVTNAIPDSNPSRPLLISTTDNASALPTTYRISVSAPNSTAYVCPDKELDVATTINVEKENSFTGNYPNNSKAEYKLVSRHAYKKALRKMAKVRRKENKIAHETGVAVNI